VYSGNNGIKFYKTASQPELNSLFNKLKDDYI
jgi:hypothetical protein